MMLFPSVRLRGQLRTLAGQCGLPQLVAAYDDRMAVAERDERQLFIDLSPVAPSILRVRSSILSPDCCTLFTCK